MSRNSYPISQMRSQRVDPTDMIGMHVSQNDFVNASAFGDQIVNTQSQGLLFVFVGRTGINDQNLLGGVNQIAVRMCRRRFSRRANREANVVWAKLNTAHGLAMSIGRR